MTRKRETIDEFTERAIRATDAGKLIPPIVYLPKHLRGNQQRLTIDMVRVTLEPPTIAENHLRIAEADPIGFLIAIMHGQPIPSFHIEEDNSIRVEYFVSDEKTRIRVASFLSNKVTLRARIDGNAAVDIPNDPDGWDEIVRKREQGIRDKAT